MRHAREYVAKPLLSVEALGVVADAIRDCQFTRPFDIATFVAAKLDQAGFRVVAKRTANGGR